MSAPIPPPLTPEQRALVGLAAAEVKGGIGRALTAALARLDALEAEHARLREALRTANNRLHTLGGPSPLQFQRSRARHRRTGHD